MTSPYPRAMPLTFIRSALGMVQTKAPTPLLFLLASLSPAPGVDNTALQAILEPLVDREIHRGIVVAIVSETGTRYLQAGDYREGDERPINAKTVIELGRPGSSSPPCWLWIWRNPGSSISTNQSRKFWLSGYL